MAGFSDLARIHNSNEKKIVLGGYTSSNAIVVGVP
jgi:hypothetical protein